jgi:anhydro-N-acetylmuramic acid kinase
MSGTSLDGIDVAVVDITGSSWKTRVHPVAFRSAPYPAAVREAILAVSNTDTHTAAISRLHFLLAELYADAVRRCGAPMRTIELIGCHGQTIFHEGEPALTAGRRVASTLQIGDGSVLAERTGIPVVSDFRTRDMAAGGKGAPLVPYLDYLMFRDGRRGRVALNLGGIANITAISPGADPNNVFAFDTGPGNMVSDALAAIASDGKLRFDRGGRLAREGALNSALLDELAADPFYKARPPKTAGREQYGREYVDRMLRTGLRINDLIATATALTARTVAEAIQRFVLPRMRVDDLIAAGGGIHNPAMMGYLAAFLPGVRITTTAEFGIDPDAKEAIAFAVLAYETWHRRPSNLPGATGAKRPVVMGKISP